MSQPSSTHSPSPDDETSRAAPRRLISPQERFAEAVPEAEIELPGEAENAFDAQISERRRDEMERRHLPPRERARQERTRIKSENLASRRLASQGHQALPASQRARAGRSFARSKRESAPLLPSKRRRVPRWLKRLLALVALIFVGQLGFAAFTAPQFEIGEVEIRGIVATPPDQLRPLARALVGQNVLRMKAQEVERAVGLLPTVAGAKVVRLAQWPPKVSLQIRERVPVLQVGAGANWWVVDQNGVPFRRPNAQDAALYNVVAPQFSPRVLRPLQPRTWARALELGNALEADNRLASRGNGEPASRGNGEPASRGNGENARFWQLRRVYFDRDGLASLRLSRAPHREMLVRLGDDAWPAKLARARQSLAYFERTGRRAAELDLVSLERPVWMQILPAKRLVQSEAQAKIGPT